MWANPAKRSERTASRGTRTALGCWKRALQWVDSRTPPRDAQSQKVVLSLPARVAPPVPTEETQTSPILSRPDLPAPGLGGPHDFLADAVGLDHANTRRRVTRQVALADPGRRYASWSQRTDALMMTDSLRIAAEQRGAPVSGVADPSTRSCQHARTAAMRERTTSEGYVDPVTT